MIADLFLVLASVYHLLGSLYAYGALRYKEGRAKSWNGGLTVHIPAYKEDIDVLKRTIKNIKDKLNPKRIIIVTDPESFSKVKKTFPYALVITGAEKGKAHALNKALELTDTEKVIVFDADSYPEGELVISCSPASASLWKGYPSEGRWSEALSSLTTIASIVLMKGRKAFGFRILPPGSGVTLDTDLIKRIKWDEEVKAEDLELGVRLAKLDVDVELNEGFVLVESPPGYFELKRQQRRWTYGAIQALKRLRIKKMKDLELIAYLTQYSSTWLPLLALVTSPIGLSPYSLALYYFSVALQAMITKRVEKVYGIKVTLGDSARSSAAGLAMSISLLEAQLRALMNRKLEWRVTPKGGRKERGRFFEEYLLLLTPLFAFLNPLSSPLVMQYLLSAIFVMRNS